MSGARVTSDPVSGARVTSDPVSGARVTSDPLSGARVGNASASTKKVVALGGGHGLASSLAALRTLTPHLTAVVTVADDGGSSGRLRRDLPDLLPPGDLRMALCALASDDEAGRRWVRVLQHRFGGSGELADHAAGNLLLAGLLDALGDPVQALDVVAGLLHAVGRVLPAAAVPLDIEARTAGGVLRGQVAVAESHQPLLEVRLLPADPPACPQAVEAVLAADMVVLGPGSLFTSVVTHLLVPELRAALQETPATLVHVLNLDAGDETVGLTLPGHIGVLSERLGRPLDVVLADEISWQHAAGAMEPAVEAAGSMLVVAPLASDRPGVHDISLLAVALERLLASDLRVYSLPGAGAHRRVPPTPEGAAD